MLLPEAKDSMEAFLVVRELREEPILTLRGEQTGEVILQEHKQVINLEQ